MTAAKFTSVLKNGDAVQAIDTLRNEVVATIPIGQLPQALVYVSHAVSSDAGTAKLTPLGPATAALHLELVPPAGERSAAHASVSVNSLGAIDNLQIAATGLTPGKMYKLVLEGGDAPQDLVTIKAGIGGVAIAQTLGPLKRAIVPRETSAAQTLELRALKAPYQIILRQKQ